MEMQIGLPHQAEPSQHVCTEKHHKSPLPIFQLLPSPNKLLATFLWV